MNETDLHQNKKTIPTDQPYLQTHGRVTATEQFFQFSLTTMNYHDGKMYNTVVPPKILLHKKNRNS